MIEFFLALAGGLVCLAAGFFLGTAYGVQQEQRTNAERQRMLRSLKQMEGRRGD